MKYMAVRTRNPLSEYQIQTIARKQFGKNIVAYHMSILHPDYVVTHIIIL